MGSPSYRHPLRVGQLRADPRTPGRVVEILRLAFEVDGGALCIGPVHVMDARDGREKIIDANRLIGWPLMPPGSVEMPKGSSVDVGVVLVGDVRGESKVPCDNWLLRRRVKVLAIEGHGPADRALVENVASKAQTRIKVSTLARWFLLRRETP